MSDPFVARLEQSEELVRWLDNLIEGQSIPANDRAIVVASCLDVALEHHKAIVLATTASFHGSAFALVRLEFEAYVRGAWLRYCATDNEIEKFKKDKLEKTFGTLIEELESQKAFDVGVLSGIKRESWRAMNSFTHTGLFQIVRRIKTTEIGPGYPDEEIFGTLDFADSVALFSALVIVDLITAEESERVHIAEQILDRAKEFAAK